jgi:alpha-tubulin suppressor-like RCC1 family protein
LQLLLAVALASGCRDSGKGGSNESDAPEPGDDSGTADPAVDPVDVTGSFLTCGSAGDGDEDEDEFGCIIRFASGERFSGAFTAGEVTVVDAGGNATPVTPVTDTGGRVWHLVFKLPAKVTSFTLRKINVAVTVVDPTTDGAEPVSTPLALEWQPPADATATLSLSAVARPGRVELRWTASGAKAKGYVLVRRTAGAVDWLPKQAKAYSAGPVEGSDVEVLYVGQSEEFTDETAVAGQKSYYAVFVYDEGRTYFAAATTRRSLPAGGYALVSTGNSQACAIAVGGRVYCWGSNASGELGVGLDVADSTQPLPVSTSLVAGKTRARFVGLSAAWRYGCGVTAAGAAYCWGDAGDKLGSGSTDPQPVPAPVVVTGLPKATKITSISAHTNTTCAATASERVYCWGESDFGMIGADSTDLAVPSTPVDTALLRADDGLAQVSVSQERACGLSAAGVALCWAKPFGKAGSRTNPRVVVDMSKVAGVKRFTQLDVGWEQVCAVAADRRPYCWGDNPNDVLGLGEDGPGSTERPLPVDISDVAGSGAFVQVAVGSGFACGLTIEGRIYCWGENMFGQLGIGADPGVGKAKATPIDTSKLPAGTRFAQLDIFISFACGLTTKGEIYCWGNNAEGQLGDGTKTNAARPAVAVKPPS